MRFRFTVFTVFLISFIALQPAHSTDLSSVKPVHAIAMHGQPKYGPDYQRFDFTSDKAQKGGKITLGVQGTFDSFHPFIPKGTTDRGIGYLYNSLTLSSADEAFTQYGQLAESMQIPEDRSWAVFNLRKNARFHDGVAVTADDVVFTFNKLIEEGNPGYKAMYAQVKSVKAIDKHTVRFDFDFSQGVNKELALIVGQFPVLPKHYWQDRDFTKTTLEPPLGSGPYKIKSFEPGRTIVYERVKDYWAKDLPFSKGLYNFDIIQHDFYKDAVVLLEALKAGNIDFRTENFSKQWSSSYTGKAIEDGLIKRQLIRHENPTGMQAFLMNQRRELFQDINVRKALTYAFDFEWSNRNLFFDAYTRTNSYFSNSELASSGLPTGQELSFLETVKDQLPPSVFTEPFTLPVSNADGFNRKNLRQAKKLLDQAGWKVKDGKLYHADKDRFFQFEIMLVSPAFERIVNPYVKALNKLGIEVDVRILEVSQYINRIRNFDYDMMVYSIGQSLSPGNEQINQWSSSMADVPSSQNIIGIKNPAIDTLVNYVVEAKDRESLIASTKALDRALLHNHYVIPQWHIQSYRLAYWDMFAKPEVSPKYDDSWYTRGLMSWWLDSDKTSRLNRAKASLKQ